MIDSDHPTLSITRQCELISLSRASYYRTVETEIGTETPENLELMRLIDEEYARHPFLAVGKCATTSVVRGSRLVEKEYNV